MGRCSVAHRTAAVLFYYEAKSITQTQRRLRRQFNVLMYGAIPSCNRILVRIRKFEDTGSVRDSHHGASRTVCSPRPSTLQHSRILGISRIFGRILQVNHTAAWTWSAISSIRLFHVLVTHRGRHIRRTSLLCERIHNTGPATCN
jgi:hypothetical protein